MYVQGIIKKVNTPSRMRKYYCGVLRRFLSQNIVAITGTLRLNRFFVCIFKIDWIFAVVKM